MTEFAIQNMQNQDKLEKKIKVDLLWFSVLAEHRGKRSESLTLAHGTTTRDLVDRLVDSLPILDKYRPYLRIAVNQTYVDNNNMLLHDGDEIALITPVSGG